MAVEIVSEINLFLQINSIFLHRIRLITKYITVMKKIYVILIFMVFALSAKSQVKQEVIASAGGYSTATGVSLSWTLGETIVPAFTSPDGSVKLNHGFQQQTIVTTVEENIDIPVEVKIYPNPASDILNIGFESAVETEISLTILDSHGRLVKSDRVEALTVEKQVNLQDLPAGVYYLRLIKGRLINVYKVVKL
jgi:hypothetical protein